MKRTTGILVSILAAGLASAQSPNVIQNTRAQLNTVQKNATAASNQALGVNTPASHSPAAAQKPAAQAAASTVPAKVAAKAAAPAKTKPAASNKPAKPAASKAKVSVADKNPKPAGAAASGNSAADSAEAKNGDAGDSDVDKDKKWSMTGKRDPFVSPVVNHAGGSGCSTGKKCLEIGAINLRGVVRSDQGFIAVVTNSLNKAYFLRENDPVFDGYVVKITGDSIVFKETVQDRLGKSFTREVVKKITTPAV